MPVSCISYYLASLSLCGTFYVWICLFALMLTSKLVSMPILLFCLYCSCVCRHCVSAYMRTYFSFVSVKSEVYPCVCSFKKPECIKILRIGKTFLLRGYSQMMPPLKLRFWPPPLSPPMSLLLTPSPHNVTKVTFSYLGISSNLELSKKKIIKKNN